MLIVGGPFGGQIIHVSKQHFDLRLPLPQPLELLKRLDSEKAVVLKYTSYRYQKVVMRWNEDGKFEAVAMVYEGTSEKDVNRAVLGAFIADLMVM